MPRRYLSSPTLWVAVLLTWVLLASLYLARSMSVTTDEGVHVASGYLGWTRHEFRFDPEHTSLFKLISSAPVLALHPNLPSDDQQLWEQAAPTYYDSWKEARLWSDHWFYASGNNANLMIFLARLPAIACLVALCYLTYRLTLKWFGPATALATLFFLSFNPTILAHGALANDDVPLALTFVLLLQALTAYYSASTTKNAFLIGLALAVSLLTKYSAFAFVLISLVWLGLQWRQERSSWKTRLGHSGIIALAVWFLTWAAYFFASPVHGGVEALATIPLATQYLSDHHLTVAALKPIERYAAILFHLLPSGYVKGFVLAVPGAAIGRASYLLGHTYSTGIWFYFPVVFFLKSQLVVVPLLLRGAFLYSRQKSRPPLSPYQRLLLLSGGVLLITLLVNKLNIGIRHITPLLPLVSISLAASLQVVTRRGWARTVICAFYALPVLIWLPSLLSYVNLAAFPPAKSYRLLRDSNLDWAQQSQQVASLLRTRFPGQPAYVAYDWQSFGLNPLAIAYYGAPVTSFAPPAIPTHGIIVVTATNLTFPGYDSLRSLQPVARIANTTFFYRLP